VSHIDSCESPCIRHARMNTSTILTRRWRWVFLFCLHKIYTSMVRSIVSSEMSTSTRVVRLRFMSHVAQSRIPAARPSSTSSFGGKSRNAYSHGDTRKKQQHFPFLQLRETYLRRSWKIRAKVMTVQVIFQHVYRTSAESRFYWLQKCFRYMCRTICIYVYVSCNKFLSYILYSFMAS